MLGEKPYMRRARRLLAKGSKQARSMLPGSSVPPFCEPVRLGQTSSEERMGGSATWAGRPARVGRLAMDGWGSCCANERERYRWHDISVAHQPTAPAFGRLREKSSNALRQPTSPAHPRAQHTKAPLKLKEAPEAPSAASYPLRLTAHDSMHSCLRVDAPQIVIPPQVPRPAGVSISLEVSEYGT